MLIWQENRKLVMGLAIAALAFLALKFTVVSWASGAEERAKSDFEVRGKRLSERRKGIHDIAEATKTFDKTNNELDRHIESLMKRVEIPFHSWVEIPLAYEKDPGAYFRTKHAQQKEELGILCTVKNVKITEGSGSDDPQDLGFKPELSRPLDSRGAQENLNRLSIVRRLLDLLAEAGVSEIVSISPGAPVKTGPERYGEIMREYPVRIVVDAKLDPLMKFLHSVKRPGEFFLIVRGLQVNGFDPHSKNRKADANPDSEELTAVISAAGMRFLSDEERKRARKEAPPERRKIKRDWGVPLGA